MKKGALFIIAISLLLISFNHSGPTLATSLRITIIDYVGNFVEGANVILYATEDDYRNETNPVADPQVSDHKGRVTFKKLQPTVYFVYAVKDDMSNIGGGVQTDTLEVGKVNKVNIIIE